MAHGRHGVLSGQTLYLRAILHDDAGELVDADSTPEIYIYDESVDVDTISDEIAARVFTSALVGPLTATAVTTGFYEYQYTVPATSDEGTWHDVWVADVDGVAADQYLEFEVVTGADLTAQVLNKNELIIIELDSTIANTGATKTLGLDTQVAFSTEYDPFYASPDLVRMELGPYADWIPDDTIALMIHWSSQEADFIAIPDRYTAKDFRFARTKFVVYDAIVQALKLVGGFDSQGMGADGVRKSLGDLTIDRRGGNNSSTVSTISSGVDVETFKAFERLRDEWWHVTNAGGGLVPGGSISPSWGIKGRYDVNRRGSGRMWSNPALTYYPQPGANTKRQWASEYRSRWFFVNPLTRKKT